jgi:hypothetical protein
MSIIITDLEMPIERESFNFTIKYNGTVLDTETRIQVAEAYELPAHGRLIDADVLLQGCERVQNEYAIREYAFLQSAIENAPTILPAEENNNDSF